MSNTAIEDHLNKVVVRVITSEIDILMTRERAELLHSKGRIQPGFYPNFDESAAEAVEVDEADEPVILAKLSKYELVDLANKEGINPSGNKTELLARLTEALVE